MLVVRRSSQNGTHVVRRGRANPILHRQGTLDLEEQAQSTTRAQSRIQRGGGVADGMLARLCLDRQQQLQAKREIAALPTRNPP